MDNTVIVNNGLKEFTFSWFIENYSYCWLKKTEPLTSPKFTADSLGKTIWTLFLYPKGSALLASKGYISLYLYRCDGDDGPVDLPLKFELAVLTADTKSTLHSIKRDYLFRKASIFGASEFLAIDEVLLRRKSDYLHQDTLNVRCKMWMDEGNILKVGSCSARTRIGIEKVSFPLKVKKFSALKPNEKKTFQIKANSKTECIINSSLYFTGDLSFDGAVNVEIAPSNINYVLRKQKLCLVDRYGNVIEWSEVDNRFDHTSPDIQKLPMSVARHIIQNRKSEYWPENELSLICECVFSTGLELEKIEEIQHELSMEASKQGCSNLPNEVRKEKLSAFPSALDDLKTFYNSQHLTDIELKTKTKSFRAHKLVLCARSSVFNAMLTKDMKEKITGCIQVDDLENDTVQQLLLFLYSDTLENLYWESAIKLYYVGDKYAIEKLKLLCSSYLIDNLSTSTAGELLLLADTHSDSYLKKCVEDFIFEHEEEIFGSDEWEKLIDTNSWLVSKTMCLKYKRKDGGK